MRKGQYLPNDTKKSDLLVAFLVFYSVIASALGSFNSRLYSNESMVLFEMPLPLYFSIRSTSLVCILVIRSTDATRVQKIRAIQTTTDTINIHHLGFVPVIRIMSR